VKLAVYLPALNEAATVGALLDSIPADIPGITSLTKIVVDDGSTDGTGEIRAGPRRHGGAAPPQSRHRPRLHVGRAGLARVRRRHHRQHRRRRQFAAGDIRN
jgi:hypothetical protein